MTQWVCAQAPPDPAPLTVGGKFEYHAVEAFGPLSIAETLAAAGAAQVINRPQEWQRTAEGYGKRVGSIAGATVAHQLISFGLDTALHEDPRYRRAGSGGFWPRLGHVFKDTVTTRNDGGGRGLSIWRFGGAYGAGFVSTIWYPHPEGVAKVGLENGSAILGFDFLGNAASEFWPDIWKKIRGH